MHLLREEVTAWDVKVGLPNDTALKDRHPQFEIAWSHFYVERATVSGKFVSMILLGLAKMFDSFDVPILLRRTVLQGFPLEQLMLAMTAHRASGAPPGGGAPQSPSQAKPQGASNHTRG